ncbi:hypothetical protein [uncultured Nostoc sp.]|uniref:hypothetical protein n=1 Tax=uncultured Nostoc sp. TaxID=340711 RepID=UPI0035CB5C3B
MGETDDRARTLQQVAQEIIRIPDQRLQRNVAAATAILAGLVLEKGLIQRVLRRDIMRESVIYQEIEAEAKAEGRAEGRAEGLQEGIRRVAINLLKSQMLLEEVAKLTGLSIEDVQLLQTDIEGEST